MVWDHANQSAVAYETTYYGVKIKGAYLNQLAIWFIQNKDSFVFRENYPGKVINIKIRSELLKIWGLTPGSFQPSQVEKRAY